MWFLPMSCPTPSHDICILFTVFIPQLKLLCSALITALQCYSWTLALTAWTLTEHFFSTHSLLVLHGKESATETANTKLH